MYFSENATHLVINLLIEMPVSAAQTLKNCVRLDLQQGGLVALGALLLSQNQLWFQFCGLLSGRIFKDYLLVFPTGLR